MAKLVITLDAPASSGVLCSLVKRLFEPQRSEVTLLHVAAFPSAGNGEERIDQVRRRLEQAFLADAQALREAGFDSSVCIRFGHDVSTEIVKFAYEARIDVIVLAPRQGTNKGSLFRRGVAQRVLRRAAVPVLVLRCGERSAWREGEFSDSHWSRDLNLNTSVGGIEETEPVLRRGLF